MSHEVSIQTVEYPYELHAIAKREAKSHAISDRVTYLKLIKSYIALPEAEEAIAS